MRLERESLQDLNKGRYAIRAKKLVSMAGEEPACGRDLFRKLVVQDNALLLVENGYISYAGPYQGMSLQGWNRIDLGDSAILPPLVNAHTHLQLSWMDGHCLFGQGFTAWLKDMIPRLLSLLNGSSTWNAERRKAKLLETIKNLKKSGTAFVGDVGGSIPGEILTINNLASSAKLGIHNFCEHFGFSSLNENEIWPQRCSRELKANTRLAQSSSPCGHALYSTSLDILRKAKDWCRKRGRIFSMHLAESEEEDQALVEGRGALIDLYYGKVIPESWRPYRMRPYALAKKIGLVDKDSLFVHGVHLDKGEIEDLAACGAALCLCPRSNANLGTGAAPVRDYIEKGARLCLGTDGLSSNNDLDVMNEVLYYRQKEDLPFSCLLRMGTLNGWDALGIKGHGRLVQGAKACFSYINSDLLD